MLKLLIIEPHCSGHRAGYVRWIVKGAIERGYKVQVATLNSNLDNPLFLALQAECNSNLQMWALTEDINDNLESKTDALSLIRREFYYHKLLGNFYRKSCHISQPDIVFVPYLEYCFHAVALLGSPFRKTPWSGIVMRSAFHLTPMGIQGPRSRLLLIKKIFFFRLLRNPTLTMLFTIDEALNQFMYETHRVLSKRLCYLPDPAELNGSIFKKEAQQILGIATDVILILVFGTIDSRKNINTLLLATQESNFPKNVHILLAGKQNKTIKDFLIKSPSAQCLLKAGRLHQINKFLNKEEEYRAFVASDIVWLGYKGHYNMSGVLVQAGNMGLPVVACEEGLIGWLTRKHKLGEVIDTNNINQIASVIECFIDHPESRKFYGQHGHSFSMNHTPQSFSSTIFDAIE